MQGGKPLTINHADFSTCNSWEDFEIHDRNIIRLKTDIENDIGTWANRNLSTLGTWIENKHQMACI